MNNENACISRHYSVDKYLYELSQKLKLPIELKDLGITILMALFARFYSRNQYAVFVNNLKFIPQISYIEDFLCNYTSKRYVYLPQNLSIHPTYGIKAFSDQFTHSGYLTVERFEFLTFYIRTPEAKPENFVEFVKYLHPSIIESFYMLTCIDRSGALKLINECREFNRYNNSLVYTFPKPKLVHDFDGDYWFQMPQKSVWFVCLKNQFKYSSYVSRHIDILMKQFCQIDSYVIGIIVDNNILYPLVYDHPNYIGCWTKSLEFFRQNGLNIVYKTKNEFVTDGRKKNIYFVKENCCMLYKYTPI